MNLQDLTLQQLKEIMDGAPEGADIYCNSDAEKGRSNPYHILEIGGDCGNDIKLSDIRAELKARTDKPKSVTYIYKLGDSIVCTMEGNESWNTEVAIIDGFHHDILICNTASGTVHHVIKYTRHATQAEKAAGHRIDAISDEMASPCAVSDSAKNQAQMDLQNNESEPCNHVPFDLGHDDDQGNRDCLRCGKTLSAIEVDRLWRGYANTVTTQLDNEAALFNEPLTDRKIFLDAAIHNALKGAPNDFDAMSEKHRSPVCKCHELPIDAELKPDPVNHPCKAAKKIKKLKKRIAQLEKERQFSELKAKDWAHKYWDSIRDNAGLYSALEEVFAERATEYEAEIERLKGEQGE